MKLPILLLMLVALSHAAASKSSKTKKTTTDTNTGLENGVSKQKETNQTSKRELVEGNFGQRISKYGISLEAPRIEYAENIREGPNDQSPTQQIFGAQPRQPKIAKISDVLTGQGPSFEVAVANHLYAPVSVYQARLSSPTSFEIPSPAASQIGYPDPTTHQANKIIVENPKLQDLPIKETEQSQAKLSNVPRAALRQPNFHFSNIQPFRLGFNQDFFQQQPQFPKQPLAAELFPLYDELGPNRRPGQVLPSHVFYQKGIYQLVPLGQNTNYVNSQESRGEIGYQNQETHEQLKAEPTERPKLQKEVSIPELKQGYHAHPNGAISYVSFSQIPSLNAQQETPSHQQPETAQHIQQLLYEFPSRLPSVSLANSEKQTSAAIKQKFMFPAVFQEYVQQPQKIQPELKQEPHVQPNLEPQNLPVQHPTNGQTRHVNSHSHNTHYKNAYLPYPTIYFQRLPAFKPLPQTHFRSRYPIQPTANVPLNQNLPPQLKPLLQPRPFGVLQPDPSTQSPSHFDQAVAPVTQERHYTPLPPLKPNYNPTVRPLNSFTSTVPVFLPTPVKLLSTSTPTTEHIPDQLISSTTIQPSTDDRQIHEQTSIHTETQPQTQTPQSIQPEIVHQSQPTAHPVTIQSTTLAPLNQHDSQTKDLQNSTPRPQYQSTVHPESINTSPRHEVVIQRQELQELIYEPPSDSSSEPHYYQQQQQQNVHNQQEIETLQLLSQQQQHELEQLQLQQYNNELHSQQQSRVRSPQLEQIPQQSEDQQYSQAPPNQYSTEQAQKQQEPEQIHSNEPTATIEPNARDVEKDSAKSQKQNQLQRTSTLKPSQEHQLEAQFQYTRLAVPQPVPQYHLNLQSTTREPQTPSEKLSALSDPNLSKPRSPDSGEFLGPVLTPIQPVPPEFYAHPQELVVQPEFGSAGVLPAFPEVQYFGKFAQSLFERQR